MAAREETATSSRGVVGSRDTTTEGRGSRPLPEWLDSVRSWLYVPGDRSDMLVKAQDRGADALVIDLEDAVDSSRKEVARANAAAFLKDVGRIPVIVRINSWSTLGPTDLEAVAGPGLAGVRMPKCEDPADVVEAGRLLTGAGSDAGVFPLLESARGIESAAGLASAHERVFGLCLGEGDLRAELGMAADLTLLACRSRVVLAAVAAGLNPPPMSVNSRLNDLTAFEEDCREGTRFGFFGRSAIHPSQVPIINEVFSPSPEEIADARRIVDLFAAAEKEQRAAFLDEGGFVDLATLRRARKVLTRAEKLT